MEVVLLYTSDVSQFAPLSINSMVHLNTWDSQQQISVSTERMIRWPSFDYVSGCSKTSSSRDVPRCW